MKLLVAVMLLAACASPVYHPVQGVPVTPWEQAHQICQGEIIQAYYTQGAYAAVGVKQACYARYGWIQ